MCNIGEWIVESTRAEDDERYQAELAAKDAEIANMSASLANKDARIAQLEAQLAATVR